MLRRRITKYNRLKAFREASTVRRSAATNWRGPRTVPILKRRRSYLGVRGTGTVWGYPAANIGQCVVRWRTTAGPIETAVRIGWRTLNRWRRIASITRPARSRLAIIRIEARWVRIRQWIIVHEAVAVEALSVS